MSLSDIAKTLYVTIDNLPSGATVKEKERTELLAAYKRARALPETPLQMDSRIVFAVSYRSFHQFF